MKIGIVGQGYVGTAVKTIFSDFYKLETYDLNRKLCTSESLKSLVDKTEIIFICVPTPMNKNGSCNIQNVESVISEINQHADAEADKKIIIIKSTVPPGTTKKLNSQYNNISIIFNPEFLTESNFINDFKEQNRIIIGGEIGPSSILRQIYSLVFPKATIIKTDSDIAEMVKYFINSFLATKVSFANEIKLLCDKLELDYDKIIEYSIYDERLGKSHWAVPGPDGYSGFGGSCFPKDINALLHILKENNISSETISGAWKTNLNVRPEKDWERLKGRAVNDE